MDRLAQYVMAKRASSTYGSSTIAYLGIWIGVLMPIISALVYPTYMNTMQSAPVEWSRLLEAPFVLFEICVILWAGRKGMDSVQMWRAMPDDIKVASIFLILAVFASSVFVSAFPLKSLTISIITIIHLMFALAVYHLLVRSKDFSPNQFVMLLGAGLLPLAALTLWRFALPPPASTVPGGVIEWNSALPGFISVRHFGSWTGAIAAGFLVKLLYDDPKSRNAWLQFFYFASTAMTIWSGTRAAVFAMLVALLIIIGTTKRLPDFRSIGIAALLTGAALTTAWLLIPYNDPSFMLFTPADARDASAVTGGRLELWIATFQKWEISPVFGYGSGSTFWEVYVGWPHTQPHNAILQFLISWGIFGALAALWLLGRAVAHVGAIATRTPSLLSSLAILYALLFMSLLEGMLHYPRFIMLSMFIFASIIAFDANHKERATAS